MSRIRSLYRPGAIGIDRKDPDDEYSDWRARYEGEPQLQPCVTCGSLYCGIDACRTATTAPAEPTQPTEAPPCRYVKDKTCDCAGSFVCLEGI